MWSSWSDHFELLKAFLAGRLKVKASHTHTRTHTAQTNVTKATFSSDLERNTGCSITTLGCFTYTVWANHLQLNTVFFRFYFLLSCPQESERNSNLLLRCLRLKNPSLCLFLLELKHHSEAQIDEWMCNHFGHWIRIKLKVFWQRDSKSPGIPLAGEQKLRPKSWCRLWP